MSARIRNFSLLVLFALAACQDNPVELPDMSIVVVEVAPNARTLTVGDTMLVQAYPKTASGQIRGDAAVQWSSANQAIAQVTPRGQNVLVRAQSAGTVEVLALSEGKEGRVTVSVVEAQLPVASLQIADGADSVLIGQSVRFNAVARAADGTVIGGRRVTWQVNDLTLGTIAGPDDGSYMVLTAHRAGTVTLTASVEGRLVQRAVRLTPAVQTPVHSIMFDPPQGVISLYTSDTHVLRVRAYAIDGAELTGRTVSFRSADSTVATVDATGRVTARAVGNTDVIATVEGKTAAVAIDVRSRITRIDVTPFGPSKLAVGDEVTVQATARDANGGVLQLPITWRSSNEPVATVDASGRVTARAAGYATITANAEGQQGWTYIEVVDWAQRPLVLIGDSTPPATLFTRTTRDAGNVERVTRVIANSGRLRLALTGFGNTGRIQLVFDVVVTVDGQAPQIGQYVYNGTFMYGSGAFTFSLANGQTLTATQLLDGRMRVTGKLEADLPVLTLTYGTL
jgi:uncharacterized protein YjdB